MADRMQSINLESKSPGKKWGKKHKYALNGTQLHLHFFANKANEHNETMTDVETIIVEVRSSMAQLWLGFCFGEKKSCLDKTASPFSTSF